MQSACVASSSSFYGVTYRLDFESDWVGVRVLEVQRLGDFLLKGAYSLQSRCAIPRSIAHLTLEAQLHGVEFDRHCGRASSLEVLRVVCW
jgi:hypothetical protein